MCHVLSIDQIIVIRMFPTSCSAVLAVTQLLWLPASTCAVGDGWGHSDALSTLGKEEGGAHTPA